MQKPTELEKNQVHIDYWTKVKENNGYDPQIGYIPKARGLELIAETKEIIAIIKKLIKNKRA